MPLQQQFFLDAPTLALSSRVFLDSGMTVCAPDGYYSDGITTRMQTGCNLLPAEKCPSCGECQGQITDLQSNEGVYYVSFETGTDTGAVIVILYADSSVGGIKATHEGNDFNELSTQQYGLKAGTAGLFTYIGGTAYDCGIDGSMYLLDEYEYVDPSYNPLGTTTNITVTTGEVNLTVGDPGDCIMVIPKTTTSPSTVDITIVGPCPGTILYLGVSCPIKLPAFNASFKVTSIIPELFCGLPMTYTYYSAPVNGDGITLGLYDWVFSDNLGVTKLVDGYYLCGAVPVPYDTFQVQDGIIIAFTSNCAL